MKRWAWAGGLALAMGSLVAGCNESPTSTGSRGKEKTEEEKLLGTWPVTSFERGRETSRIGPKYYEESFYIFSKGGKLTKRLGCLIGESVPVKKGTFKINATKTPKEIDLIFPIEGGKQVITEAIYQLDGDTLKMAFSTWPEREGDRRPTSFDSKQDNVVILTLKRDTGASWAVPWER